MKKLVWILFPMLVACRTTVRSYDDATLARRLFGVTFPRDARPQADGNLTGLQTDDLLFSHRTDSRTFFVQDKRASSASSFQGSDARLIEIATGLLRRAGIPRAEIVSPRVIQEQLQAVNIDRRSRTVLRRVDMRRGMHMAHVSRQIGGVPVFNSRLVLTVDENERPTFAELHWPEIPEAVVAEASYLQRLVREGWQPPGSERMHAESIDAGIIHSPAPSFVMDFAPVIRVVYESKSGGMKPMLFFDRNGQLVAPPRTFPALPRMTMEGRPTGKR